MSSVEELLERLGRTKRRIMIELYKRPYLGYKKLAKQIGVGLDSVRSALKAGKYSKSLTQLGLVERKEPKGWAITPLGLEVLEQIREDPAYRAFFYEEAKIEERPHYSRGQSRRSHGKASHRR